MADHLIVLDFFGLPGCGKSVCSHELAKMLSDEGHVVDEITYNMDHHNSSWKRFILKSLYTTKFVCFNPSVATYIDDLIAKCCKTTNNSKKSQRRNIFYKLHLLKKEKSTIAIMDEGIAQAAISLTVGTGREAGEVFSALLNHLGNVNYIPIQLVTTIDTSLSNMSMRTTNDSRVEKIDSQADKLSFMTSFQEKINQLSNDKIIRVVVNEDMTPVEVAAHIKQILEYRINA